MPRFKVARTAPDVAPGIADRLRRGSRVHGHMADRLESGESVVLTGNTLSLLLGDDYAEHVMHWRCRLLPDGTVQGCMPQVRILPD